MIVQGSHSERTHNFLYEIETPGVLTEFNVVAPRGCRGNWQGVEVANASTNAPNILRSSSQKKSEGDNTVDIWNCNLLEL
jgi:hypothetical protein